MKHFHLITLTYFPIASFLFFTVLLLINSNLRWDQIRVEAIKKSRPRCKGEHWVLYIFPLTTLLFSLTLAYFGRDQTETFAVYSQPLQINSPTCDSLTQLQDFYLLRGRLHGFETRTQVNFLTPYQLSSLSQLQHSVYTSNLTQCKVLVVNSTAMFGGVAIELQFEGKGLVIYRSQPR